LFSKIYVSLESFIIIILITQTHCCITTCDDDKIKPIPRVSQVGVFVEYETLGDDFYEHFDGVDGQEEKLSLFKGFTFS
jgi:hypothetical protein